MQAPSTDVKNELVSIVLKKLIVQDKIKICTQLTHEQSPHERAPRCGRAALAVSHILEEFLTGGSERLSRFH